MQTPGKKFSDLVEIEEIKDTDITVVRNETGVKKTPMQKISDYVKQKFIAWVFEDLPTQSKTIPGALKELNSAFTVKDKNIEGSYLTCNVIGCGKITWFRISCFVTITLKQGTDYKPFKIVNIPVYTVFRKIYLNSTSGFAISISSQDGQVTITPFGADIKENTGINVSEVYITK